MGGLGVFSLLEASDVHRRGLGEDQDGQADCEESRDVDEHGTDDQADCQDGCDYCDNSPVSDILFHLFRPPIMRG